MVSSLLGSNARLEVSIESGMTGGRLRLRAYASAMQLGVCRGCFRLERVGNLGYNLDPAACPNVAWCLRGNATTLSDNPQLPTSGSGAVGQDGGKE